MYLRTCGSLKSAKKAQGLQIRKSKIRFGPQIPNRHDSPGPHVRKVRKSNIIKGQKFADFRMATLTYLWTAHLWKTVMLYIFVD
jgi:hypothetical protein